MSDTKAKSAAQSKPEKTGRKDRRTGDGTDASRPGFSVAGHPRAQRSVREIKAWIGLAGFTVALVLSLRANVPLSMAAERALIGGIGGYLIAWGCALAVWRALLVAELRVHAEQVTARREEAAGASTKAAVR